MGNEKSKTGTDSTEQGTCLGSSVDPPSSQENHSGAIHTSKNDSKKTFCKDLTKREMCFKDGSSTTSRSSDSTSDKIDFGGVSLHTENGLSRTGLKSDTKTSSIDSSDKNPTLQNIEMKEQTSIVKSNSFHSADLRDNAKTEKLKEKDEMDLNTHLNTAKTARTSTKNVVGHLKEEDEKCTPHDETQNYMNTFESHSDLSNTHAKSTSQEQNDPDRNDEVDKDDSETNDNESQEPDNKAETIIQGLVQRCYESVENLEKEQHEILNLLNKRSSSDSELHEEGVKIIAELESIVKKFVERKKEKDEGIVQLTSILDRLTENVKVMEQEIQTLELAGGNGSECEEQCEEIQTSVVTMTGQVVTRNLISENIVERSMLDQNSNSFNPLPANPDGEEQVDEKRHTSHNIDKDMITQETRDKEEGMLVQHPGTPPQNSVSEDNLSCSHSASHNTDETDKRNDTNQGMVQQNIKESQLNSDESHKPSTENTAADRNSDSLESSNSTEQSSTDRVSSKESIVESQNNILKLQREPDSERNQGNTRQQQKGSEVSNLTDAPNIVFNQNMSKTVTHMKTLPSSYWTEKANEILQMLSLEGPIDNECGQCNVLCLDTSDSMWGESFRSMTNLALRFISGIENSSMTEKVGLVCFGEDTRVISRCSTNFSMLRQEIKKLKPAGPSPVTAGLMLALALVRGGVTTPSDQQRITYHPRIIVLTDGVATPELTTGSGDFIPDLQDRLMINLDMESLIRHFRRSANRVYCVPLGKADESLIEPLVRKTGGKFIKPTEFDKLIHQFGGELLASAIRSNFPNFRQVEPYLVRQALEASSQSLKGIEMDDLVEYVRNPPPQVGGDSGDDDDDDSDDNDNGNREINANMPPIGTRVRRGPDWDPRFREQDSHGPGTVVSHGRDGFIWVIWDNGHRNRYPYGSNGQFAVMVVDEPRFLQHDQFIEVGCLVKRGDNWRDDDQDGGPGSVGVVFRVHSDATVGVRWPNGLLRRYKYGKQGYMEVELCDPFNENAARQRSSMGFQASSGEDNSSIQSKLKDLGHVRIEDIMNSDERNENAIEEMNRRNALQSSQLVDQVKTDSGGGVSLEQHRRETNNSGSNNVGSEPSQNGDMDATRKSNMKKEELQQPIQQTDTIKEGLKETHRNEHDSESKELSSPDPNLDDGVPSRVDKNNDQNNSAEVKDANSQNTDKTALSRSSSSDLSFSSDLSCDMEVSTIAQATNQRPVNTDQETKETVKWQRNDRYEGWKDFPEDINNRLEKAYQKNPHGNFSYSKGGKRFQIQLSNMIHIHPVTKEMSSVRRKET